jgi:hypothetical protein
LGTPPEQVYVMAFHVHPGAAVQYDELVSDEHDVYELLLVQEVVGVAL